jgi:hypothetical protein
VGSWGSGAPPRHLRGHARWGAGLPAAWSNARHPAAAGAAASAAAAAAASGFAELLALLPMPLCVVPDMTVPQAVRTMLPLAQLRTVAIT